MSEEAPTVPFGSFHPQLDTVATAIFNKLEREWPVRWLNKSGAPTILRATVAVARNTYRSVVFLCADGPEGGRKPEFSLSAVPLARTILDSLFTLVALFENLGEQTDRFYRGGWREIKEELQRHQDKFGSDPNWADWLEGLEQLVEGFKVEVAITPADEAAFSKRVPYWPTPGQLLKDPLLSPERRGFLEYLTAWFYREMSSDSHLSLPGLARRSVPLLEGSSRGIEKHRSDCVMVTAVLLLCVLSEIQLGAQWPDITPRLEYVWSLLGSVWEQAREIYEMRYDGNL